MAKPRLFLGTRAGGQLAEAGVGYTDLGLAYNLSARTNKLAPAGAGGECIFTSLYLTVVHYATIVFRVTPFIDEVAQPTQEITLIGTAPLGGPYTEATRKVEVVEVGLSRPYLVAGVERLRTYPRGTWIEALIETNYAAGGASKQRFDAIEVEHEIVVAPAKPVGVAV